MIITNSVIISVALVFALTILKVNVVIALTASALIGGIIDGFTFHETLNIFSSGLGDGAQIALSYAILGAFAASVAHSGVPIWLAEKIIYLIKHESIELHHKKFIKVLSLILIGLMSLISKNLIPVHIAFIPILIPPLLDVFGELQIDRRLIACVMTFGLVFSYMVVPYGFGNIFLEGILLKNLTQNGMPANSTDILHGMIFPAIGMIIGLITSIYAYRKPRKYQQQQNINNNKQEEHCTWRDIIVSAIAIITTLAVQLYSQNIIASALAGFCIFTIGGVVHWQEADDVVTQGFKMMSLIAFIMIAAAGFSEVLRSTGDLQELVTWLSANLHGNKLLAVFGMLTVGLLITLGIGSSFSTVPIIAGVYVPFCSALGLNTTASICVIASAAVIGDAGSPVSDTMLGISTGLNADGQSNHILDVVLPALLHFNIPVMVMAIIGVYVL